MWSNGVNLRATLVVVAVGTLGVFMVPRRAEAQMPGGSYAQSCRNEYVSRDGVLHAECRTVVLTWRRTSIVPEDCRDRDISNVDGQLACGERLARDGNGPRDRGGPGRVERRRDYSGITLFTDRRFRGRNMFINQDYSNLGNTGFNDVASSVQIQGDGVWRLCSDKNYGGRCVNVTSSVSDLRRIGLGNNISSVRRVE